jgi:hypothetical protein
LLISQSLPCCKSSEQEDHSTYEWAAKPPSSPPLKMEFPRELLSPTLSKHDRWDFFYYFCNRPHFPNDWKKQEWRVCNCIHYSALTKFNTHVIFSSGVKRRRLDMMVKMWSFFHGLLGILSYTRTWLGWLKPFVTNTKWVDQFFIICSHWSLCMRGNYSVHPI